MGKIVLGIAAVLCLDIAFIVYLYTTNDPESQASVKPANTRRLRPPKTAFPPLPNQSSISDDGDEQVRAIGDPEQSILPKSRVARGTGRPKELVATPRTGRNATAARNRVKDLNVIHTIDAPARRSDIRVVSDETGTTILYRGQRAEPETLKAVPAQPTRVSFAQPERTSFAAKAVHIVKKPWSIIKTACAKLSQ